MNRPRLSVRVAGAPVVALVLFVVYAALALGWYQGGVPWWVGVAAIAAAGRTLGAVKRMRRYKAWLAEWQAMGAEDEAPAPEKKRGGAWGGAGAALLFVAVPVCLTQIGNHATLGGALTGLWLAACLALAWKLAALVRRLAVRSAAGSKARRQDKAEPEPVAWLVGRASSSPSRAEAQRELPEYSARLLIESGTQG